MLRATEQASTTEVVDPKESPSARYYGVHLFNIAGAVRRRQAGRPACQIAPTCRGAAHALSGRVDIRFTRVSPRFGDTGLIPSLGIALPVIPRLIVIIEYPCCSAIQVVKLAAFHRPKKSRQAYCAEKQCDRDQYEQGIHAAASLSRSTTCLSALRRFARMIQFRRTALVVTRIDDDDMASAAISGVAKPKTASGTAITL